MSGAHAVIPPDAAVGPDPGTAGIGGVAETTVTDRIVSFAGPGEGSGR